MVADVIVCEGGVADTEKAGAGGAGGIISMPLIFGASAVATVKEMPIVPVPVAFVVNCCTVALLAAPAVAMMSKLVSTCVPLIETLNLRCPAAVQKISAKCRRTR